MVLRREIYYAEVQKLSVECKILHQMFAVSYYGIANGPL